MPSPQYRMLTLLKNQLSHSWSRFRTDQWPKVYKPLWDSIRQAAGTAVICIKLFLYVKYNPKIYVFIYFSLIFVFASVYCFVIPDQFYQSALVQEPFFKLQSADLRNLLEQSLNSSLTRESYIDGSHTYRIDHITVKSFEINNHDLVLRTDTLVTRNDNEPIRDHDLECKILLSLPYKYALNNNFLIVFENSDVFDFEFRPTFSIPENERDFFVKHATENNPGTSGIFLTQNVIDMVRSHKKAIDGSPEASGVFFRMLYLSVVIMTTLGLGDIIPMTTPARLTVGFQAILGIVLMGYYLASLSEKQNLARTLRSEERD
jgi:hypothetical protein